VKVTKPTPPAGATPSEHGLDVVISRGGRAKSYTADGTTREEAVEKVIRQIIDTRDSLEWLP
jgi:hypothetical protein